MELRLFRTFWGVEGPWPAAAQAAREAGFDGIETPVPDRARARGELAAMLRGNALAWIGEVCTGGGYVPRRQVGPAEHLADLRAGLDACEGLEPVRVNCIGGLDAWPLAQTLAFLAEADRLAHERGLTLCFETHRSRCLFNPWVTLAVAGQLPGLRLTADLSHWCVVAERTMDTEIDTIRRLAPQVHHVHARVGYAQGPQVPHPAAPEYRDALDAHLLCWEAFWAARAAAGDAAITMTPEFGPDGYLHTLPFTGAPVADLWQVNRWMADTLRAHYAHWQAGRTQDVTRQALA